MKKWILIFLFLHGLQCLTHGQYYRQDRGFLLGINAGYLYPSGDMGKILKNGLGANLSAKYLINEVLGIGFEGGYYGFKSKVTLDNENTTQDYRYRLTPLLLEATFYIPNWDRSILPYLGLQFGGYLSHLKVSRQGTSYSSETSFSKKLFLFSPGGGVNGGVLLQISDRTWLDLKVRADYVPKIEDKYRYDEYASEGNIGFNKMLNIGGNIGLLYKW